MLDYLYLHGFASSPQSTKAIYLRDRLSSLKIPLTIPDLNQGDFSHLTITRQIKQVAAEFPPNSMPVTVIGSSLGGLTAAWVGEKYPQVQRLVLLAPAFEFLTHWLLRLGEEQLQQWQTEQYLPVYHYGEKRSLLLHYQFVTDAAQYQDEQLQRPIPTLLLHGRHDEVIPIAASRNYAASRPWVKFIELEDDHSLGNVLPEIWELIEAFCY
ncbi:alpha/beta fold hydrolase [Coleofasciculus sp. FACHB-712]|uniref:YqiA/YcfP family alpha/beta fold hydrolase n=1 Tax=Coleofasciculus sp. FACHB-712 TaxID=2692789 RepID=UPI0016836C47|nr:YqiA/YcfP family alpha/beta fold hydrolase [Coleofasciculus sp. FACHB-712]MBD1942235.1 alpha/beta fold hydrolase [Coleofasciculus sp. FACHB-712]